jgi:hypothetical protein
MEKHVTRRVGMGLTGQSFAVYKLARDGFERDDIMRKISGLEMEIERTGYE